jgi:hypothetical protein
MTLTRRTAPGNAGQHQAEQLTPARAVTGMAETGARGQARRRPLLKRLSRLVTSKTDHPNELDATRAKLAQLIQLAEIEQQTAQNGPARILNEHSGKGATREAAVNRKIAELESELGLAREELIFRENQNCSLQTSLDLVISENARLSRHLTESNSAVKEARSLLLQSKTALAAAEAERNKLAFAIVRANEDRETEASGLNAHLRAMSSRAVAAEKMLALARQNLLARSEAKSASEYKPSDEISVRIATEKTPEPLRDSLDNKERKIRELEQLCCELTEGASKLLKTFDGRNTALTRAEEQIRLLDERCAHLEAKANLTNSEETIEKLNSTQRVDRVEPAVLEGDFTKARSRCAGRSRSNNSVRKINKNPEQAVIRPTEGLLDRTISF